MEAIVEQLSEKKMEKQTFKNVLQKLNNMSGSMYEIRPCET